MIAAQATRGFVLLALATCYASAQEVVEFEGPEEAPVYVLEGSFKQSGSIELLGGSWNYSFDLATTIDVNSGSMLAMGTAALDGNGTFSGRRLERWSPPPDNEPSWRFVRNEEVAASVSAREIRMLFRSVVKQAGGAIRWSSNGMIRGDIAFQPTDMNPEAGMLRVSWSYRNVTLDPLTGEQIGLMSLLSFLTSENDATRFVFLSREVSRYASMPRPDIYESEGEWSETAGRWFAKATTETSAKGKVRGTGELVFGDPDDPFATVAQRVNGRFNSKTDAVTLSSVGTQKKTSRVKVNLSYSDSTGEILSDKGSIRAYGQKRKF